MPVSPAPRSAASYGEVLGEMNVGRVKIRQRYGCIRRDHYELLTTPRPFPEAFRDALALRGALRQGAPREVLYVLDVAGAYQLTVAPRAGRALLVPKLSMDLARQKTAALDLAALLDELLDGN